MADSLDSDEENFEDALDIIPSGLSEMDLGQAIAETNHAMHMFLNNKFAEALAIMKPKADRSMYHSLGCGTIMHFQAIMTFESRHIEAAIEAQKRAVIVSNAHRRKNTMTDSIAKMVKGTNYNLYTDLEVHAELCYAESLLERALLTFVQDENLVSFIKGGLKIRSCYQSYKECVQMLQQRTWQDENLKRHFESGVHMGVGGFNLLISCLPSKILKLLEFIGFSGSRTIGLRELDKGYRLKPGLRGPLCALILLAYHTIVTYFIGLGEGDLTYAANIITPMLELHPKGVLFLFFAGRLQEVKGNMDDAIFLLRKAIEAQHEWKQFHHLCYWELMWCHCFKCEWSNAAYYADVLFKESRWSRTTYAYQKAAFMCMMDRELTLEAKAELKNTMTRVPDYKQRIAGKSLPMEKFSIKKSERFLQQGERLIVPALELIYVWNGFSIVGQKLELIDSIFGELLRSEKQLEGKHDSSQYYYDDYCLVQLLKGMCLKNMNSPLQAEECFKTVLQLEKKLKDDLYIAPFALVELGLLHISLGNLQEAMQHLETARCNYKGYSLESRLHFKIHAGFALIKVKRKELNLSTSSSTLNPSPTESPVHALCTNGVFQSNQRV